MSRTIKTYAMSGETERLGFAIRDQTRISRTDQPHRHEFFQMRLDVAGAAYHSIGSQRRNLCTGSVTFVLPYRLHRGGRRPDSQFFVINFHHRFLRPRLHLDPLCLDVLPLDTAPELTPFILQEFFDFRLTGDDLEIAHDACRQMLAQSRERRFFSPELIRANLLRLIGVVCQRYERDILRLAATAAYRASHHGTLAAIVRHVSAHLGERLTLPSVAAELRMSPNNVTRLLKKHIGKTFIQLLTERRLRKAQELLANTDLRIADIGEAVGFEDNAYFARRFKQHMRLSPRAYRMSSAARRLLDLS